MKIALCFFRASVLLFWVNGVMSHQELSQNPKMGTSGKKGDSHFHDSQNAQDPVLLKAGSSLQGRTIYKTAWSEESDKSNSKETLKSSEQKLTSKSGNTWNLGDLLEYILSFLYQNENSGSPDQKKSEIKNYKPEGIKNKIEYNKNLPSSKLSENNVENSGSIPTESKKENQSEKKHNYLEYYFQNNNISLNENVINDESYDGDTDSTKIDLLNENSYEKEDFSFEASEVDDMTDIEVINEKDIEVDDDKCTEIINEEDIEIIDKKDIESVDKRKVESVDGKNIEIAEEEDMEIASEKDAKESNPKISKTFNKKYSSANKGGSESEIFIENVNKNSSSVSDIRNISEIDPCIETENEIGQIKQNSPKVTTKQSIHQSMETLAEIDKKKQFNNGKFYDHTDTNISKRPTNDGQSSNENNKKATKNSLKEGSEERVKNGKSNEMETSNETQSKDLNGNIANEEISNRAVLKQKKETGVLNKQDLKTEKTSTKTFSQKFETFSERFYKDTTTEIPKQRKKNEDESDDVSLNNNHSKDKIITTPTPFTDVRNFHSVDENPKENLLSQINKLIRENNENGYTKRPAIEHHTHQTEKSFQPNEAPHETTSYAYTTTASFKYDVFNYDMKVTNNHPPNTSSLISRKQDGIHTDTQKISNIPKKNRDNKNDATHIGKKNTEGTNKDFNAKDNSEQKTVNTSQINDEKRKEGYKTPIGDENSVKNSNDSSKGTFAIDESDNGDQLYEYVLASSEFIELNGPYRENTEDLNLKEYDFKKDFDVLPTNTQIIMFQKEDNYDEFKESFDTILEYLYKNSNNSFIQSLKTKQFYERKV